MSDRWLRLPALAAFGTLMLGCVTARSHAAGGDGRTAAVQSCTMATVDSVRDVAFATLSATSAADGIPRDYLERALADLGALVPGPTDVDERSQLDAVYITALATRRHIASDAPPDGEARTRLLVSARMELTVERRGRIVELRLRSKADTGYSREIAEAIDAASNSLVLPPLPVSVAADRVSLTLEVGMWPAKSGAVRPLFKIVRPGTVNMAPVFTSRLQMPRYPEVARRQGVEGDAMVLMRIDESGKPMPNALTIRARIPAGASPELAASFGESVLLLPLTWKFLPAKSGTCAVIRNVVIPIHFRIGPPS